VAATAEAAAIDVAADTPTRYRRRHHRNAHAAPHPQSASGVPGRQAPMAAPRGRWQRDATRRPCVWSPRVSAPPLDRQPWVG